VDDRDSVALEGSETGAGAPRAMSNLTPPNVAERPLQYPSQHVHIFGVATLPRMQVHGAKDSGSAVDPRIDLMFTVNNGHQPKGNLL
jgi:hypothetical protein